MDTCILDTGVYGLSYALIFSCIFTEKLDIVVVQRKAPVLLSWQRGIFTHCATNTALAQVKIPVRYVASGRLNSGFMKTRCTTPGSRGAINHPLVSLSSPERQLQQVWPRNSPRRAIFWSKSPLPWAQTSTRKM